MSVGQGFQWNKFQTDPSEVKTLAAILLKTGSVEHDEVLVLENLHLGS
jgi:hypothetical protein